MRTLLPALITCALVLPVHAQYSGGSGTADEPYEIDTAADLIVFGETPEDYDKTAAEMQEAQTFLEAGWDFGREIENGAEDMWSILAGQDYPRLWWELLPED